MCFTRANVGTPRHAQGVRIVGLGSLAADIANRPKILPPSRAQRAAQSLGVVLARERRKQDGGE